MDEYSICEGCEGSEQFEGLEKPGTAENIYKTRDGKDAVLKEDVKLPFACAKRACRMSELQEM